MLELFIAGVPRPQGSKNAYKRGARVVLVESNKHLPEWRQAVYEALMASGVKFDDAVHVKVIFFIPRAKSNKRMFATVKPDTDKLIRAIGDSLTKAGTIKDDSYIVQWIANKEFADQFQQPGVAIWVTDRHAVT